MIVTGTVQISFHNAEQSNPVFLNVVLLELFPPLFIPVFSLTCKDKLRLINQSFRVVVFLTELCTSVFVLMYTECIDDKRNTNGVLHSLLFLISKRNRTARNHENLSSSCSVFNHVVMVSVLKLIMVKAIWGWDVITVFCVSTGRNSKCMCPSD